MHKQKKYLVEEYETFSNTETHSMEVLLCPKSLMQTGITGAPDVFHLTHYVRLVVCPWAVPEVFTLPFDNLFS